LWVPPNSRANIEQSYVIDKFGPFFRINTIWLTPGQNQNPEADVFQKGYLEMLYYLQNAIEEGTASVNGMDFKLDDFCYKPISGKGCIVTSPMQYWRSDLASLLKDKDVKQTAQCVAPPDATERVCFDKIGVPVMQFTIFGGLKCEVPKKN
jgi:Niemann-Pick C1 protein